MAEQDRHILMIFADKIKDKSNCSSRHIGCLIVSKQMYILSSGANITPNPYCVFIGCHKEAMGAKHGEHSIYCDSQHAEEVATKLLKIKISEEELEDLKPLTAVMTCGYPCRFCLEELINAGITRLILGSDVFYNEEDKNAWETKYKDKFTDVWICPI